VFKGVCDPSRANAEDCCQGVQAAPKPPILPLAPFLCSQAYTSGQMRRAWISYNGNTTTWQVFLSSPGKGASSPRPNVPVLVAQLDAFRVLGTTYVYPFFTGGSSCCSFEKHVVHSFRLTTGKQKYTGWSTYRWTLF